MGVGRFRPFPPAFGAGQDSRPSGKKSSRKKGAGKKASKGRPTTKKTRKIEYISVPKHWFSDPLQHTMRTLVRPPTALTRRKQQTIDMKMPEQLFFDLLRPLETGDAAGLKWVDEEKSALQPTKDKPTYREYKYTIAKPALNDKIWRMQETDQAGVHRGKGCARLHLSAAAEERGDKTGVIAQVTGNVILSLKVPKMERAMPLMRMTLAVSTMNETGDVVWANTYAAKTAAALRKQMRSHLQEMMNDPKYPTLTRMKPALTEGSEVVRELPEPPARPAGLLL